MVDLRQRLQQKLLQKLSPQQIQTIKLLELPTLQLEQRIKKELEENPILEEGHDDDYQDNGEEELNEDSVDKSEDEFTLEDYLNDEDVPSYKLVANNYSKDDKHDEIPFSGGTSFHEYLETQLGLRNLTERQYILGKYLIGSIDDDGYIRRKLTAVADDIAFALNLDTNDDELEEVLYIIHDFDPIGVGARDLQECLLLQIESKDMHHPEIGLARKILKYHFDEFTKKHYDKIQTRLGITEEQLKNSLDEILRLNPKPGSAFGDQNSSGAQHITPDFILEVKDGELSLSLNSRNLPDLKVSREYSQMLEQIAHKKGDLNKNEKETLTFVKQKLDSAKWFIDALKQRQNTLLLTINAIIDFQRDYFIEGDETKLRPMILKDIAQRTGLDISTISRVVNSKYIQTHFGILSLKYFFSEGLQTDSGEEASSREIKSILSTCIEAEDKKRPLTDEALMDILQEKGYQIARRTVSKYREQLDIPVARLRKEL